MAYLISDLKSDLQRKLHGTSLAKLSDVNSLIWEAGKEVIARIDPQETIKIADIENAIYDDVFDYTAPTDLKGNKVIDIRPQVKRTINDNFNNTSLEQFDLTKSDNTFTIQYNNYVRTLRLSKELNGSPTLINAMNSITSNGTWAATGNASNLSEDNLNFISGGSSLKFDLAATVATGILTNTTMTAVDLSTLENEGALFLWVFMPTASAFTSVQLEWSDDATFTAKFAKTNTTPHDSAAFVDGWNLLRFDWKDATETGTVDTTKIDSARVTFTYDGTAQVGTRINNLTAQLGRIWEVVYYSQFLFRNTAGTFIEKPLADTDLINLENDSYNIMLYECARIAAIEIQGTDSRIDVIEYEKELYGDPSKGDRVGLYKQYARSYPSEAEKKRLFYYTMPTRTYDEGVRRIIET